MEFLNKLINNISLALKKFFKLKLIYRIIIILLFMWVLGAFNILFTGKVSAAGQTPLNFTYNDNYYVVNIPSYNDKDFVDYTIFKNNGNDTLLYILVTYDSAQYCNLSPFYSVGKNWVQMSFNSKQTNFSLFRYNTIEDTLSLMVQNSSMYELKWSEGTWTNTVISSSVPVYAKSRDNFGASGDILFELMLPYIDNTYAELRNLSFLEFKVNGGSYKFYPDVNKNINSLYIYVVYDGVEYNYNNSDYFINIYDYLEVDSLNYWKLNIDRNFIFQKFLVENGKTINITVGFKSLNYNFSGVDYYEVSTGDIVITDADVVAINNDVQRNILEKQLEVSENAFQNSLVDNNILNSFMNMNVPDLAGRVNVLQLFNLVYDAFTKTDYDALTLQIPHSDTELVIDAREIVSHYPSEIVSLVQIIWWGVFGFRIIIFIYGVFIKISTGVFLKNHSTFIGNQSVKLMEDML